MTFAVPMCQQSCCSHDQGQVFDNFYDFTGYPRNPFNDVICNDTISASGVFTAKELCRLSRGIFQSDFNSILFLLTPVCSLASIMSGASSMHGSQGGGGQSSSIVTSSGQPPGLNGVKLEGQYYCNSYTPPTPVDHSLLPPSYSKYI